MRGKNSSKVPPEASALRGRNLYAVYILALAALEYDNEAARGLLRECGIWPSSPETLKERLNKNLALYDKIHGWIMEVRQVEEELYFDHYKPGSPGVGPLGRGWTSPFHLALCPRCSAPSWAQPCRFCQYWPFDQDYAPSPKEQGENATTYEFFHGVVTAAVNFTALYYSSHKSVLVTDDLTYSQVPAYKQEPAYKQMVQLLIAEGLDVDTPTPGEIWAAVKHFGFITPPVVAGEYGPSVIGRLWEAQQDVQE